MADATALHDRLVQRSVGASYTLFLGLGAALTLVGLVLFALSASGPDADRAWHLFHVNWLFFTSLSAGGVVVSAAYKTAHAKWHGVIIRFAEASGAFLPVSFLGFLVIFSVGYPHIFGHLQGQLDSLSAGKHMWMSRPWMFWRLFITLGALYTIGLQFVWHNLLGDIHAAKAIVTGRRRAQYERWTANYDAAAVEERLSRLAPLYVWVYAFVFTLLAFDTVMGLQPHWYSNLFGGFFFMGAFLGSQAALAILMMYGGRQLGIGDLITDKQRHDIGKLIFGFSVFWTYLMWSQFLVIWYGNMPEETGFVFARLWGHWEMVGRLVFLGLFLIPFIGLLGVAPKKFPFTLGLFSWVIVLTLWLERYLLVLPSVTAQDGPVFGLPELGSTLAFLGLFLLSYALFARTFPMVSPRLAMIALDQERVHH